MMFDYQAGEKFKLTLIMVGFAGLMAGMLFTMILMPPAEAPKKAKRHLSWSTNPDVTGQGSVRGRRAADSLNANQPGGQPAAPAAAAAPNAPAAAPQPAAAPAAPVTMANPQDAINLVTQWLPLTWDLSAASVQHSQEQAIMYMTPECATAYRQNIWTPQIAQQIQQSGLQSKFECSKIQAGQPQADGSVVVFVEGTQTLSVPGKGEQPRQINYQYLVKTTVEGYRIAGISEGGAQS
jgi:hypothetical protein